MHLDIVTPEKNIFQGEVTSLTVPTESGEITILPDHVNLLTSIVPGEAVIKDDKKTHYIGVTGGFIEVNNNKVTLLSDFALASEDVAIEKVMEAEKRAEELKKKMQENISQEDLAIAGSELRRSLMQIHVTNRRRHRDRIVNT